MIVAIVMSAAQLTDLKSIRMTSSWGFLGTHDEVVKYLRYDRYLAPPTFTREAHVPKWPGALAAYICSPCPLSDAMRVIGSILWCGWDPASPEWWGEG